MSTPFFEIAENESTVELIVSGDLTIDNGMFRSNLLKLLQHGNSKSYTLNLAGASALDNASMRLICILKRELAVAKTSITIALPSAPGVRANLDQRFVTKMIS